ncbi:hypothetical protein FJ565_003966 [Escherichia coli]|nr:hypothetical protein [Escherichia coli]
MKTEQIKFKDFKQGIVQNPGIYSNNEETHADVVARINTWLAQQSSTVINIETLYFDNYFVLRVWLKV